MTRRKTLVTGAQQGIGAAIAAVLAAREHDVAIAWHDDEGAAMAVARAVEGAGGRAVTLQADLSDAAATKALVADAAEGLGGLDGLVNNAAIFPRSDFLTMPVAEWDAVMHVNLRATFVASQAAARIMAQSGGAIVHTSSQAVRGVRRSAHYVATKGAIETLTRAMALDLAPHGIRVNAVAPGLIDTAQPRVVHTDAELAERGASVPLGRIGQPEDIARTVAFLLSDDAAYITGEVVKVTGGSYMG